MELKVIILYIPVTITLEVIFYLFFSYTRRATNPTDGPF